SFVSAFDEVISEVIRLYECGAGAVDICAPIAYRTAFSYFAIFFAAITFLAAHAVHLRIVAKQSTQRLFELRNAGFGIMCSPAQFIRIITCHLRADDNSLQLLTAREQGVVVTGEYVSIRLGVHILAVEPAKGYVRESVSLNHIFVPCQTRW